MKGRKDDAKIRLLATYLFVSENESFALRDITRMLASRYGIMADRKTIYSDLIAIDRFLPLKLSGAGRNAAYRRLKWM